MALPETEMVVPAAGPAPAEHPCDRCEKVGAWGWFGSFWLCPDCVLIAADALGKEAAGRAIERLARAHQLRADLRARLAEQQKRMYDLLAFSADPGRCKACEEPIFWIKHKPNRKHPEGVFAPYNPDGQNHFATCPFRERFRGKGGA